MTAGDELTAELRDIRRRLAALETAPALRNASVGDAAGVQRITMGQLPDGTYGFQVTDGNGVVAFQVDSASGITAPMINLPYRAAAAPISAASSTMVLTWETSLGAITHDSLRWGSLIQTEPGTTAEAGLYLPQMTQWSAIQVVAGGNNTVRTVWNWNPPLTPQVRNDRFLLQLWVRRATGTGYVYVYAPDVLFMANRNSISATTTGTP